MKTTLLVCLFGLWSVLGMAAETDRGSLSYNGSRGDQNLSLNTETMRTEYRWVQVPYQERVCRTVIRYRRECRQQPPRHQCRAVNKPVCRVQRTCRVVNGRQVCRQRRVCRDRPVRVCRVIPGRRVCRDVPYQHRVCRMETRYRQERRAYQVVDQRTSAYLGFSFTTDGSTSGIRSDINASLQRNHLTVRTEDFSSPRRALLYSLTENRSNNGRDTTINQSYRVRAVVADELFAPVNGTMTVGEIQQGNLSIVTGPVRYPLSTVLYLRATSGRVFIDRDLSPNEYRIVDNGGTSQVLLNLRTLFGADYTGREFSLEVAVKVPMTKILNSTQFSRFENRQTVNRMWR